MSSLLFRECTVLECHTYHLAARMIWTINFGRTSILVGWWFSMVWTGWSSIFSKHPFQKVALILFILFFKIILEENNSKCSKELNKFCPPNSSNDLCLLFCLYPSSMGPLQPANNSLWPTVMYEDGPPCIIMPIYGYVGRPYTSNMLISFPLYIHWFFY